ncbi:hypothetical protein NUITMVS1_14290 [Shewanella xiamenensis]|jgi:hypothetical protein|nr:hypothetical protein NUITMVS1_14290 [Shewanella xiamenensis]
MKQDVTAYMKYYNLERLHSANDGPFQQSQKNTGGAPSADRKADPVKTVFQVAAFNPDSTIAFNRKINRPALLDMLRKCESTLVVMEACYSANYWGRAAIPLSLSPL